MPSQQTKPGVNQVEDLIAVLQNELDVRPKRLGLQMNIFKEYARCGT